MKFGATLGDHLRSKFAVPALADATPVAELRDRLAAAEKKLEVQLKHSAAMEHDRNEGRNLLRIAMRVLLNLYLESPEAREAVDEIASKAKWAIEKDFVKFEKGSV